MTKQKDSIPGYWFFSNTPPEEELAEMRMIFSGEIPNGPIVPAPDDGQLRITFTGRILALWFIAGIGAGLVLSIIIFVLPILYIYGNG